MAIVTMIRMRRKKKRIYSPTKRKILLLLYAGIALGLSRSPRTQGYIFKQLVKEWKEVDKQYLRRLVDEFYNDRLIDWQEKSDGSVKVVLTEEGKRRALEFNIDNIKIKKPAEWDKKWRVVFFDIPEKRRNARDALRDKLKELGFYELQKSVFIYPFVCKDEIDFLIEFFDIRPFVYYADMTNPTNEAKLKLHFDLV